jgi:branched-chain amino acid aminotransferase
MAGKQYVWMDGRLVDFKSANVHILTHSLQYGSGIFEGIRAYKTMTGTAIFRLEEHVRRFLETAKIYDMNLGFSHNQLKDAITDLVKKNGLESCYIRPFAFYNDQRIGLSVTGKKISVAIAAVAFGNYFEDKNKGIKCKVSSWRRINSEIMPPHAKGSGNYMNSVLASEEAKRNGADEAILLGLDGYVAEGPGENIFLVKDEKLLTPPESADILLGITRDSIIKVAESMGLVVEERNVHREELYIADELFFTGTAAELTPITSVDGKRIGLGHIGPITKMLSEKFTQIVTGEDKQFSNWLSYL